MNVEYEMKFVSSTVSDYLIPSDDFYKAMCEDKEISLIDWIGIEVTKKRWATSDKTLFKWARCANGEYAAAEFMRAVFYKDLNDYKAEHFSLNCFIRGALAFHMREALLECDHEFVEAALICILDELGYEEVDETTYEDMRQALFQEILHVQYEDFVKVINEHLGAK